MRGLSSVYPSIYLQSTSYLPIYLSTINILHICLSIYLSIVPGFYHAIVDASAEVRVPSVCLDRNPSILRWSCIPENTDYNDHAFLKIQIIMAMHSRKLMEMI